MVSNKLWFRFKWYRCSYIHLPIQMVEKNLFVWMGQGRHRTLSKQHEDMPRFNLLLIEKAGTFHNTWIKDFSREG